MRPYLILIFLVIVMAFSTGYFALSIQRNHSASDEDIFQIISLKRRFQKSVSPVDIVNLSSIYHNKALRELLDPVQDLTIDKAHQRIRYSGEENCFRDIMGIFNRSNFHKVLRWESYRCGNPSVLTKDFFETPPYMHPSGKSFALIALQTHHKRFENLEWVSKNLYRFHVSEFPYLRKVFGTFSGPFEYLSKLSEDELIALAAGQGTLLTREYMLARIRYPASFSIKEYRVYSRALLDQFLEATIYQVSNYTPYKKCLYKDGTLCWNYSSGHVFSLINKTALFVLFGLVLITVIAARLLWFKLKSHKIEDERRRLALRVLTHEFRTPVTSMLLFMEKMSKKNDSFDDEMLDIYLRLSSEVYRMKRLVDTSSNYLKMAKGSSIISFKREPFESLSQTIELMLREYLENDDEDKKVVFHFLGEDGAVCLDHYWFRICLKNLVENALFHGTAPVEVSAKIKGKKFEVRIKDQSKVDLPPLKELTTEFYKGQQSSGTGLGLNIVNRVIKEMGGELKLLTHPTVFVIKLPYNTRGDEQNDQFTTR